MFKAAFAEFLLLEYVAFLLFVLHTDLHLNMAWLLSEVQASESLGSSRKQCRFGQWGIQQ
jgi:hypothetical protein